MKKRECIASLIVFISFLTLHFVSADGFVMVNYDPDLNPDRWNPLQEKSQFAFINYDSGIEKMLISVSIDTWAITGKEKVVWIFPVPAPPEQTSIDILNEIPDLKGTPLGEVVKDYTSGSLLVMSLTQIYPAPFLFFTFFTRSFLSTGGINQDVEVYEHVEKMGITTELISAKSPNALSEYTKSKNLVFPEGLNSILEGYINEDYCFVISWISNVSEFKKQAYTKRESESYRYPLYSNYYSFGIYTEFPAEEIYFPLKPTSMYGQRNIPIIIYVMNYVTPELYPNIEDKTTVEYFYENNQYISENLTKFFNKYTNNLAYTKIKIQTTSDQLTEDLIISEKIPIKVRLQGFITNHIIISYLIIFILFSCLSSLIAGLIAFRKQSPYKLKFFLFGLFNFLTLIGISIASNKMKIEEKFVKIKKSSSKKKGHPLKTSAIASLMITAAIDVVLIIMYVPNLFHAVTENFHFIYLLGPLISLLFLDAFIFVFLWIIITPIVYIASGEKGRSAYIAYFTIVFVSLLIISWVITRLIL